MVRKTPANIEAWVAEAIRAQFDLEVDDAGSPTVQTDYDHNAGDYEIVRARFPDLVIEDGTKYSQPLNGRTIRFSVLESEGDGAYRLRVRLV